MTRLVLASTSPYRRALLGRLGLPFEIHGPGVDEEAARGQGVDPEALVVGLARAKAETVARRLSDGPRRSDGSGDLMVIGSDQVAELQGEILGKPGTPEKARAQLRALAGREHRLLTALCVIRRGEGQGEKRPWLRREALDVHLLRLRPLTDAQIARYVDRDQPLDCAGSYKVEGAGIALFEWIRGDDFTGVVGLPLTKLVAILAELGVTLP